MASWDRVSAVRQLERRGSHLLVRVGAATEAAAGHMVVFELGGTMANVANTQGRLYAFDDTCTHRGCSLAMGDLDGTVITCACHGSQFDVTSGAVLRGPAERPPRSRVARVDSGDILVEA